MDLGLSGLVSGFDWRSLVDQLSDVERAPQRTLQTEKTTLLSVNTALGNLKAQLEALQTKITALQAPELYASRLAKVSDTTLATATAGAGAALGEYTFAITQYASAAAQAGGTNTGAALSDTNDVSGLVLADARFARAVTAGTFTVNGQTITVATTDTLQDVFDRIATATGGAVTASYDAATDKISLASASPIVLGSAADTSNFLLAAKLYNNGTGAVESASALGAIKLSGTLAGAGFATAVSDGGSGAGEFKINGVSITYSATGDSVANLLDRINNSAAGVIASYDAENDRFTLTNKTTGDVGIALEDVTGNFLAAAQLTTGTLQRGNDLHYSVNGGATLVSRTNVITSESSGIAGLSVNLVKGAAPATVTVSVTSDTEKIKTAINDFLAEYNKTQALIDTQTASSTDAKGKVTAGVLAGRSDVYEIAKRLRGLVTGEGGAAGGTLKKLYQLGIDSNGHDNSLALTDSAKLDAALNDQLSAVASLFSDETGGLATALDTYLDKTIGEEGTLVNSQDSLKQQSANIDTQIAELERYVQANRERLIASFIAMETAQAKINQQLQFLQQRFGGGSSGS